MSVKHYGPGGVEWTREQFLDYCFQFTNPIWDSMVADFGICTNCGCSDCGCCVGCGGIDADLEPQAHGYACVM